MSVGLAVLAWLGLALGALVLLVALDLLNRLLRPIREIRRYTEDTLTAGLGIARHLDGVDEAVETRNLASALPALVDSYLERAS